MNYISFGSCFASEIGNRMEQAGYAILNNPFGVLFNPASIAASINRLINEQEFTTEDVIDRDPEYGKRAGISMAKSYASFYHHSKFAAHTQEEFLARANSSLHHSAAAFRAADAVIITFGTSWVFRHIERDIIVSNCHKRLAAEFTREFMAKEEIVDLFSKIVSHYPRKRWIFTVSPIRHLKDGLHGNQLSKANLLLAIDELEKRFENVTYFPSYEIVLDELRDYRFYADDKVHPTQEAIDIIWKRFEEEIASLVIIASASEAIS